MIFSSIEDDLTLIPAFSTWLSRQTKTMVCSPWFQPFPHDFLFNGRRSHLKSGLFHIILSSKEDDLTLIPAFSTWFSLQWKTISPWFHHFHMIFSSIEEDLTFIPAFSTWFSLQWKTISPWFQHSPHDFLFNGRRSLLDSSIFHMIISSNEDDGLLTLIPAFSTLSDLRVNLRWVFCFSR